MAKRITVTAIQPLHHEGRSHVRGSVFTTTPLDAASLKYRGKVKLGGQLRQASGSTVPDHQSIARRMEPVKAFNADAPKTSAPADAPMPGNEAPVETIEPPATEPVADPQESARAPRRRGRLYQRRDMQAEEPNS